MSPKHKKQQRRIVQKRRYLWIKSKKENKRFKKNMRRKKTHKNQNKVNLFEGEQ